jgi:crotonobetainyl-CoA:carnitine CoA-transferase CaiB-like acyl-CoA transferase
MPGVLDGIRVLDFGRYIAGPYCASLLADLGADVVRVERLQGGDDRYLMPATEQGDGAQFLQCNRGKRCLALNMSSPKGRQVVRDLVARADVVVANFSPGALKHFGLDYGTLKAIKGDIILTSVSAFGSEGPHKERIGFDGVGQAVSGAIWLSGIPGQPTRSATAFVDFGTALSCAYGTLAAIMARQKTGNGAHVQASLAGTAMAIMNQILIEHASGMNQRVPTGNRSPMSGPSDLFVARDGWFIMQVIGNGMFERWTKLLGRPDLATDPRFATDILRGRNGEELSRLMADWSKDRSRDECLERLVAANIGCGPVLSPAEVVGDAMGLSATFLEPVDYPGSQGVRIARTPVKLPEGIRTDVSRPPLLGEHTDVVLAEFGFADDEIAALRRDGVI